MLPTSHFKLFVNFRIFQAQAELCHTQQFVILSLCRFHVNQSKEEPDITTEASITTSADLPTLPYLTFPYLPYLLAFLSTTFSLNTMICEGYLCSYGYFQVSSEIESYEECEKACEQADNFNFVTFLFFKNWWFDFNVWSVVWPLWIT